MKRSEINKNISGTIKFIYRVGLMKSIFILLMMFQADAEYEIEWKGHHVHLRKGTTDFKVFKQVMVFGNYELKGVNQEVETVVDLGANIGLSTLYLKTKYPRATIISIEPEGANFEMLKKNVAGLKNVHCLQNAIWSSTKQLELMSASKGAYAFYVKDPTAPGRPMIEGITMNDVVAKFNLSKIDLLKIDIEGSEKELFAENYAGWLPKVGCIVVELHDWFRPGCASSFFRAVSNRDYILSSKGENVTINFQEALNADSQITHPTIYNAGIV